MTSQVAVEWVNDNVFLGNDEAGHSVVFDAAEKGANKGMSPMDLLLTALGACSGMDVVAILRKRRQKLTSLKISVSGERPQFGYPKPFTSISVRYVLTGRALQREYVEEAVKGSMEKYCSVAATVNGRAKVSYTYEMVEA
jgi:putative redox protein